MTLVDANAILDLVTEESPWADWSSFALHEAGSRGPLLINDIIYAEVAARFDAMAVLEEVLLSLEIMLEPLSRAALYSAGRAHRRYRENDGPRVSILPDFIVGAHAPDLDCPLLTRNVRRYRTYFPDVRLITP